MMILFFTVPLIQPRLPQYISDIINYSGVHLLNPSIYGTIYRAVEIETVVSLGIVKELSSIIPS